MPRGIAGKQNTGRSKYGLWWDYESNSDLDIELWMIRNGGRFMSNLSGQNRIHGEGLFHHYREMQSILWPEDDHHRWSDLLLDTMVKNEVTVILGSKDCSKTFSMAKFVLCDWWAYPEETLWLVSSTEIRGAELRIWGALKRLYNRAKDRFPNLPGYVIDSAHVITSEKVEDKAYARELTKGLVLVPCGRSKNAMGLGPFIGAKAPRLRHAGDEVSVANDSFLNAYSNWHGKENFKGIMAGNITDLLDNLGKAARPVGGWEMWTDTKKTQTWRSSFFDAAVVALDGRDSPNNDFPELDKPRYPYLITRKAIESLERAFGLDSWQVSMQGYGKPNKILGTKRVITQLLCEQNHALEDAIWKWGGRTMVYGLDPAYGGGDLCVGMPGEFGLDIHDRMILKLHPPEIIPVYVNMNAEPDAQIAGYIQRRLQELNIPAENCFYGAFGKGTLGNAFAKVFGFSCPVPIDEGGMPTKRPVRDGLMVTERDGTQRPMRCDEYYDRRISQLWYDARLVIESEQMRELPRDAMEEGCLRIFRIVKGHKIAVETKDELKKRMQGESPNKFDALTFVVAGALLRGFKLARLGGDDDGSALTERYSWLYEMENERWKTRRSKMLQHA